MKLQKTCKLGKTRYVLYFFLCCFVLHAITCGCDVVSIIVVVVVLLLFYCCYVVVLERCKRGRGRHLKFSLMYLCVVLGCWR